MKEKKMEENKNKLPIPVNAPDRNDYVQGFGNKELTVTAGVALLAIIYFICMMVRSTDNIFKVFFMALGSILFTVALIVRDRYNETIIDKIRVIIQYQMVQKKYKYNYRNLYETEVEDEIEGKRTNGK
ncbi:MAG: hypothetical protein RSF88_06100 [Lachnospiraceae bacterium]